MSPVRMVGEAGVRRGSVWVGSLPNMRYIDLDTKKESKCVYKYEINRYINNKKNYF